MNQLNVFYRISDKGEEKRKLEIINNRSCLKNFMNEFPSDIIEVIADNVEDSTIEWLNTIKFKRVHRTSLGNSGSFWFAFRLALGLSDNQYAYFVENDYIHRPGAMKALLEGLEISDYVTLYDHPDKYLNGINPKVKSNSERSRVFLTDSSHWKITNSTTMTFASKASILRKDRFIFKLFTVGIVKKGFPILERLKERRFPADYRIFTILGSRSRKIICSIPGFSTHGESEFLSPLIDWKYYL
jgi:hypothetical protein